MPDTADHEGECSFLFQPLDDDGRPQDRDHCRIPGCGKPRVRTVEVREPFLRAILRDALAFAQALANSGDPEALESMAEYETALLELSSAPAAEVAR